MAYQIKRRKRRTQELELVDENGLIQRKIVVELDTDTMMKRVMEAYRDLCSAHRLFQNAGAEDRADPEQLERLGLAVTGLIKAVFDQEDAQAILAFYEDRSIEMCTEIIPLIIDRIIPELRHAAQEDRRAVKDYYRRNSGRKNHMVKR